MSLKIGVIPTPPYSTACAFDPKCPERGYAIDAVIVACEYLKVNCSFNLYPGEYGSANDSGKGTGLIGAIQRGEFDTTIPIINPTYRRSLAITFSTAYFYFDLVLATRIPEASQEQLNWSFLYAFQWPVILAYLFALISISVLITGFSSRPPNEEHSNFNWISVFFHYSTSLITQKYKPSVLVFIPIRLLIASWALAIVVLGSTYINLLISQKVVLTSNLPFIDFETFVQCLEARHCRFITHDTTASSYQQVIAPGPQWNDRINRALIDNPAIVASSDKIPDIMLKEKRQYLVWPWLKEGILYNVKDGICQFYIIATEFENSYTFAVRKDSPDLPLLSELGLIFQENGLAQSLQSKYNKYGFCDVSIGRRISSDSKESLQAFITFFLFYACGVGMAFLTFVVEFSIPNLRIFLHC